MSDTFHDRLRDELFKAYFAARQNKRNTKSQLEFELDLDTNVMRLCRELEQREWRPSPALCFIVETPVKREVFASQFRDRVVHHLLYNVLVPIFDPGFIHDCYSCRKGKGTSKGVSRLEHHIRSCSANYTREAYVLKLDLRGYFMSINKQRLYDRVSKGLSRHWLRAGWDCSDPIRCPEFVDYLVRTIIFNQPAKGCIIRGDKSEWEGLPPSKSLLRQPEGVGLPIGDITSQLFSNIYLCDFDNHMKRALKLRHYGRYVDDFYVVHSDKQRLKALVGEVSAYLASNLGLEVHPKKVYLQSVAKGVEFLGAWVKPYRKHPTNRTFRQFRAKARELQASAAEPVLTPEQRVRLLSQVNSYCGYMRNLKGLALLRQGLCGNGGSVERHINFQPHMEKGMLARRYRTVNAIRWARHRDLGRMLETDSE